MTTVIVSDKGVEKATLLERRQGFLVGAVLGDALGGPYEFQNVQNPDCINLSKYGIAPTAYGQWNNAVGSVTDDTRLKIIFFNTLKYQPKLSADNFAREVLMFADRIPGKYGVLCKEWLQEIKMAAQWQLGEKNEKLALPPDRLWAGTPSIAGQMALIPLASLYPDDPEKAYRKAWEMNIFDTGFSKDLNASVIAGLSHAMSESATWKSIEETMLATDPFRFGGSSYGNRSIKKWIDVAHESVRFADGSKEKLFLTLEENLHADMWWESWVPITVVLACAELANYEPRKSMEFVLQFGHDTDSYAQLMGAFLGALHGEQVFESSDIEILNNRLREDYNTDIWEWFELMETI